MIRFVVVNLVVLFCSLVALAEVSATPLDLNQATVVQLMELPGIGRHRAEAILQFRATRPFRRPADLLRIKGFGRRTFVRLKPLVTVGTASPSEAPMQQE